MQAHIEVVARQTKVCGDPAAWLFFKVGAAQYVGLIRFQFCQYPADTPAWALVANIFRLGSAHLHFLCIGRLDPPPHSPPPVVVDQGIAQDPPQPGVNLFGMIR